MNPNMTADEVIEERDELLQIMENCQFKTPQDVCDYFTAYTKLIWTHKQIGYIYERYNDTISSRCDGGEIYSGAFAVVAATLATIARYPDLEVVFCEIHCTGNEKTGYRFGQVVYNLASTRGGISSYGIGTGVAFEPYEDLEMCECVVQFVEGKWRIVDEWENRSSFAYERVLKPQET